MNTNNGKMKDLALAVAAAVICVIVYHAAGTVFAWLVADEFLSVFLAQAVFAVLMAGAVVLMKKTDLFHSDPARLKSGWASAGMMFVIMAWLAFLSLSRVLFEGASITPVQWALFIGTVILVGFCEEVLFRGLIQNALHKIFGEDSHAHVVLAVFCSGLLFGLAHLVNMDRGVPMLSVLQQAGVNIFSGMLFGAIYYRTGKNIGYMIFLHALYDFLGMIVNGRASGTPLAGVLTTSGGAPTLQGVAFAVLVWGAMYLLTTLFILRPKKVEPLLAAN